MARQGITLMTEEERLEQEARRRGISVTHLKMQSVVSDDLMRSIVSDFRSGPAAPSSAIPPERAEHQVAVKRGTGWQDQIPLRPPEGSAIIDRLMDAQDRIDRAELAQKLSRAGLLRAEEKK
jgi:hypothetical protein